MWSKNILTTSCQLHSSNVDDDCNGVSYISFLSIADNS